MGWLKFPPPPPGLKHIVPNYYFAFSCRPLGTLVRFQCGGGGGGGHSYCNASLSQFNVQKDSRALVRGMRGVGGGGWGGFKFDIFSRKQSPYLRKTGHIFPCILYFFIHTQPNNIGPAWQEPRDWGSLNFSESDRRKGGGGAQLLLISLVTTWGGGGGGGAQLLLISLVTTWGGGGTAITY